MIYYVLIRECFFSKTITPSKFIVKAKKKKINIYMYVYISLEKYSQVDF